MEIRDGIERSWRYQEATTRESGERREANDERSVEMCLILLTVAAGVKGEIVQLVNLLPARLW